MRRRLAAVALVLLTACAGSPNARPPRTTARPTTTTSTSTTSTTVASTTSTAVVLARPCSADDLGISDTHLEGAGGHTGLFVSLKNLSADTCSLSGFPAAFTAETPTGQQLADYGKGSYFPGGQPGNLEPHAGNGLFVIETTTACMDAPDSPPARDYKRIRVTFSGGGTLSLGDTTIDGRCGVIISTLGVTT